MPPAPYTFPAGNVIWKPVDIIALLCQPQYMSPDDWRPITGCAVCLAESGGNPLETGIANWNPGHPTHLSIDLGGWQLNSYYHTVVDPFPDVPKITVQECFDMQASMAQVWKVINKARPSWNYNWTSWTTFNTGAYDKHLSAALAGMKAYRSVMGLSVGVFG